MDYKYNPQSADPVSQYGGLSMKLANKVALITGGNSGIGSASARLFVAEGARVAITGRNPKTLQAAAKELGEHVLALTADVTDIEATERAVDTVTKQWGKLDIVFANAGFHELTPIGQTSVAQFERIIRANLTGVFFTIQAAAPHLNEGASIILNGSVQAVLGIPGFTAYAAAKGGIRTMTRNLASEFAPRKIRVNQVTPGATRTPIWSLIVPTEDAERELEQRVSQTIPLGRFSEADEVAKAVLYLASDDSAILSGTEIVVDGGATGAPHGAPAFRR
jgi:NAD(P)-dependent dehydrogenase (short-subunit alcohol dehydrogenase family)